MDNLTTSTGVVFRVKRAPAMAFQTIVRQWKAKEPKVPVTFIADKERNEENPADPDYQVAKKEYEESRTLALFDAAILLCTQVESIPEGVDTPEDEGWLEDLTILGISPGPGRRERYLAWVKYYAAPEDTDMMALNTAISRRNGVSEGDVTAAMAALKSAEERGADRELPPERAD